MVKPTFTEEDDALLAELGIDVEQKKVVKLSPREERIIAGFQEIERFIDENEGIPQHGENKDIFERLYAVRLDRIRSSNECRELLVDYDANGLLAGETVSSDMPLDDMDDEALLAELGVDVGDEQDITKLKHVRTRAEIRAAEEIAQQTPCEDFEEFKHLFDAVQSDLKTGERKTREFKDDASIQKGDFFILSGKITYVAEVGEEITAPNGTPDARLRVIYDNGTESNLLRRSLQRALFKDSYGNKGRRITSKTAGPLFSDEEEDGDIETGLIYVLRSKSENPEIKKNYELLHKIGVTGGDIKKRIANAQNDPTFLLADVEVVATYKLSNINRVKLENLIHKFFDPAKLDIEITDRFGRPVSPREWFLVPLFIIDEAVEKIREGVISEYAYSPENVEIYPQEDNEKGTA